MKEIGFVGLGAMGSAMAPLLSKADFNVYGYDIKKPKDNNQRSEEHTSELQSHS